MEELPRSWRELIGDVSLGSITLVIGAGVSLARGVPSWGDLVRWACREVGYTPSGVDWIADATVAVESPLALQIALEEVEQQLRSRHKRGPDPVTSARREFANLIATGLYQNLRPAGEDSLACIVDAVRRDQQRIDPLISRIITFNADDLLEKGANEGHSPEQDPVVWPISRANHHPRRASGAHGRPPIPVYHVHGYLPRDRHRSAEDSLVFTDAQYWASMANPISIANRVFTNALHDSHCIFLGMSMTDMNVNRWLGSHALDVESAKLGDYVWRGKSMHSVSRSVLRTLRRHYWVRASTLDLPLMERHLLRRGVVSIPIENWLDDFRRLMQAAFGA